ncbi:hypothetical protein Tco_0084371 [Tanacetum coccineum]
MMYGIEESGHGPSDAMYNPSQPFKFLSKDTYLICHGDTHVIYRHLTSRLLILNRSKNDESNAYVLEDLTLSAGNPVKEDLLMNLTDQQHQSKRNVFDQKAQVHVIILFRNSDNQELSQCHQRSSKSNKNCSIEEIVSLDEEKEIASFQDKYE